MNKQEILRHISGFYPDITVDSDRYVYLDNNFICGMEIIDDAIIVFYPYRNKERCDIYKGIDSYEDVLNVWNEFKQQLDKSNAKLRKIRKDELRKLVQGSV